METFFAPPQLIKGQKVFLDQEEAWHAHKVLRLRPGDEIRVADGQGSSYRVIIRKLTDKGLEGEIVDDNQADNEPKVEVSLAFAPPKGRRAEILIEKGTELGAKAFLPLITEHTVVHPSPAKIDRWRKIAQQAMKQSGRSFWPIVAKPQTFAQLLGETKRYEKLFICCLHPSARRLKVEGSEVGPILLTVGPEGGFSPAEVERARENGFYPLSLGKRRLRSETAAIAALTLLLHELGEI